MPIGTDNGTKTSYQQGLDTRVDGTCSLVDWYHSTNSVEGFVGNPELMNVMLGVPPTSGTTTAESFTGPSQEDASFHSLVEEWARDTGPFSLEYQKAMPPAYQRISGMGEKAIPLILRELQTRPGHWFWALRAITGESPVRPNEAGRIALMADRWIQWGKARGYIQ